MATSNRIRALNRLPFDFEDGLKVGGVDVTNLNQTFTPAGAGLIGFTPVGNLAAGNVQAALAELDSEKVGFSRLDDTDGSSLVGYDGGTVQDVLDSAKPMADYTALRTYTGRATSVRITSIGIAGFFYRDDADTSSADNGGTVIVAVNGKRWKRLFSGAADVMWFGAKGDWNGTTGTNDAAAFQSAINSEPSIYIPNKTFVISTRLNVPSNKVITGEGYIKSTITNNNVFNIINSNNVVINGLTIENEVFPSMLTGSLINAIYVKGSSNVFIRNTKIIHKSKNYGIALYSTSDSKVSNNFITCIDLVPDALDSETPAAITVADGCKRIIVAENNISNTGLGISILNITSLGIEDVVVNGNTIYKCSGYGILSYAGGGAETDGRIRDVTISNNTIRDIYGTYNNPAVPAAPYTHGAGIYILNGKEINIFGNNITNTNVYTNSETLTPGGIGLVYSFNCSVVGNSVKETKKYGIIYDGGNGIVSGNTILDSGKAAIYSRNSSSCAFSNNAIAYKNVIPSLGILLTSLTSGNHTDAIITGNTVYDADTAIGVSAASNTVISANSIKHVTSVPTTSISVSGVSPNGVCTDNVLTCNGGVGIRITGAKWIIKGNVINDAAAGTAIGAVGADGVLGFNRIDTWSSVNKSIFIQMPASTFLTPGYFGESGTTISLTSAGSVEGVVLNETLLQVDIYIWCSVGATLVHLGSSTGGIKFRNKGGVNITTDVNTIYHYRSFGGGNLVQI